MNELQMRCPNKNCPLHGIVMLLQENVRCPYCGSLLEPIADTEAYDNSNWLTILAEDDQYWITDAEKVYPSVIAYEYKRLREYCRKQAPYAVLLSLKDNFESILKLEVLLSMAWIREYLDDDIATGTISLLTTPNLSMGAWMELASIIEKSIKSANVKLPEAIPLSLTRKEFARNEVVNWRNLRIGHGAMCLEEDEDFRKEIKDKLLVLRKILEVTDSGIRQQELYIYGNSSNPQCGDAGQVVVHTARHTSYTANHADNTCEEIVLEGADRARGLPHAGSVWFRTKDGTLSFCVDPFIIIRNYKCSEYGIYFFDNQRTSKMSNFLAYADGRYSSEESDYFRQMRKHLESFGVSLDAKADSIYLTEDELRQLDILQMSHKYVRPSHLMKWLDCCVKRYKSGIFYLQMERGTGKSTFTENLNCLFYKPDEIFSDIDVRTYHFGRIQSTGTSDFCSMIEWQWGNQFEGRNWARAPRIADFLNKGLKPSAALCAFLEAVQEYSARNRGKKRLLMVLDGLDEIKDEELWQFLPTPEQLKDGIYILLTSRIPEKEDIPTKTSRRLKELPVSEIHQIEKTDEASSIFLEKYIDRTRLKGLQNYQREKLKQLSDHRVLLLGMYCRLAEYGMAIEDLPETSKVVAAYLETIENGYTEKEAVRMREMLAVLCTLGTFEPLTMEALRTLYREDGISLHLIGMLRDLAPILKVERSADGNGYRIANPELAKELAAQIPETEDEVRRIVNLSMSILTDGLVRYTNSSDIGLLLTEAFGSVRADGAFGLKPDIFKKEPGLDIIVAHVVELAQQYLPEGIAAIGREAYDALMALTENTILIKNPQDVKRMQDYYKQLYSYCKGIYSEKDLATAKAEEKYGNYLAWVGKYAEALPIQRDAVENIKNCTFFGELSSSTLAAQRNLAITLSEIGLRDEAEEILKEAYKNSGKLADKSITLDIRRQLIYLSSKTGYTEEDYDAFLEIYEEQLKFLEPNSPEARQTVRDLSMAWEQIDPDYKASLRVLEKLLAEEKEAYGEDNWESLITLECIGNILAKHGEIGEAVRIYRQIFMRKKETLGESHPQTLHAQRLMADALGFFPNEEELNQLKELLKNSEALWGNDFVNTLNIKQNLVNTTILWGDKEEAVQMQKEIYETKKELLGEAHPETIEAQANLNVVLAICGRFDEVIPPSGNGTYDEFLLFIHEVAEIIARVNNQEYTKEDLEKVAKLSVMVEEWFKEMPDIIFATNLFYGDLLVRNGCREKAFYFFIDLYDEMSEQDADQVDLLTIAERIAYVECDLKQYENSIEHYQYVYTSMKELLGKTHPSTLKTLNNMAYTYSEAGDFENAVRYQKELLQQQILIFGEHASDTQKSKARLDQYQKSLHALSDQPPK